MSLAAHLGLLLYLLTNATSGMVVSLDTSYSMLASKLADTAKVYMNSESAETWKVMPTESTVMSPTVPLLYASDILLSSSSNMPHSSLFSPSPAVFSYIKLSSTLESYFTQQELPSFPTPSIVSMESSCCHLSFTYTSALLNSRSSDKSELSVSSLIWSSMSDLFESSYGINVDNSKETMVISRMDPLSNFISSSQVSAVYLSAWNTSMSSKNLNITNEAASQLVWPVSEASYARLISEAFSIEISLLYMNTEVSPSQLLASLTLPLGVSWPLPSPSPAVSSVMNKPTTSSLNANSDLSTSAESKAFFVISSRAASTAWSGGSTVIADTISLVLPQPSEERKFTPVDLVSNVSRLILASVTTSLQSKNADISLVQDASSASSSSNFVEGSFSYSYSVFSTIEPCWIAFYVNEFVTQGIVSNVLSANNKIYVTASTEYSFRGSILESSSIISLPVLSVSSILPRTSMASLSLFQPMETVYSSVSSSANNFLSSVNALSSVGLLTFTPPMHTILSSEVTVSSVKSVIQSTLVFPSAQISTTAVSTLNVFDSVAMRNSSHSMSTSYLSDNVWASRYQPIEGVNLGAIPVIILSSESYETLSIPVSLSLNGRDSQPGTVILYSKSLSIATSNSAKLVTVSYFPSSADRYSTVQPSRSSAYSFLGSSLIWSIPFALSSSVNVVSPGTTKSMLNPVSSKTTYAFTSQVLYTRVPEPGITDDLLLFSSADSSRGSSQLASIASSTTKKVPFEVSVVNSWSANSLLRSDIDHRISSVTSFLVHAVSSEMPSSIAKSSMDSSRMVLTSTLSMCLVYYTSRIPVSSLLPSLLSTVTQDGHLSSYRNWKSTSPIAQESAVVLFTSALSYNENAAITEVLSTRAIKASSAGLEGTDMRELFSSSDVARGSATDSSFLKTVESGGRQFFSSEALFTALKTPSGLYVPITTSSALSPSIVISPSTSVSVAPSTAGISTAFPIPAGAAMLKVEVPLNKNLDNFEIKAAFSMDMEQKLLEVYIFLEKAAPRRRRAATSGNYTAEVLGVTRLHSSVIVAVEFRIIDRGAVIPASMTASRMNELSAAGLAKRIGYTVLDAVEIVVPPTLPPEYVSGDIVAIILSSVSKNISSLPVLLKFQADIAAYYKKYNGISNPILAKVTYIKHEYGGRAYVEFYLLENRRVHNATVVSNFFKTRSLVNLTDEIGISVFALPYASNLIPSTAEIDRLRLRFKAGAVDVASSLFVGNLTARLADVYTEGRHVSSRRRRAAGSVVAHIVAPVSMVSGKPDESEVIFSISDQGAVVKGAIAAAIMNRVRPTQVAALLGVQMVLALEPIVALPVPIVTDPDYWLIAAVLGPVVVVIVLLVLIFWRWRTGGPRGKIAPAMTPPSADVTKPLASKRADVVPPREELEMKSVVMNSTTRSRPTDDPASSVAAELKTAARRKVQPQATFSGQATHGRQNPTYDHREDEEDDDEDDGDDDDAGEDDDEDEDEDDDDERGHGEEGKTNERSQQQLGSANEHRRRPISAKLAVDQVQKASSRPKSAPGPQHLSSKHPLASGEVSAQKLGQLPSRFNREVSTGYSKEPVPTSGLASWRSEEVSRSTGNARRDSRLEMPRGIVAGGSDGEDSLSPTLQASHYSAGHVPSFGQVRSSPDQQQHPPLRFRTRVEPSVSRSNLDAAYTSPSGPLPALDLQHTSLVAALPELQIDSDLKQKADMERVRNKQRQRDRLHARPDLSTAAWDRGLSESRSTRLWKHEQDKIAAVLDPAGAGVISDLSSRKARIRKRLRRKHKIDIAPKRLDGPPDVVRLTSFQQRASSPKASSLDEQTEEDSLGDSEVSMREARKRIHDLLDDTFDAMKVYEKKSTRTEASPSEQRIRKSDRSSLGQLSDKANAKAAPQAHQSQYSAASMLPPSAYERPIAPNPYGESHGPYLQRPPMGEPLIIWDPVVKQRFLDHRYGLSMYNPAPSSGGLPYVPSPNLYRSAVGPHFNDYAGAMWNPSPFEQLPAAAPRTVLPGDAYPVASGMPGKPILDSHITTIDTTDSKLPSRLAARDSQPLIRAIRDELLRLSQAAHGKTRVQELNPTHS